MWPRLSSVSDSDICPPGSIRFDNSARLPGDPMSSANSNPKPAVTSPIAGHAGCSSQETQLARNLGPVLLLTFIFFTQFVVRQISGPLLPAMESDLDLSHTQSGLFILFTGTGFFLSQISAAFLTGRLGYRRCIMISLFGTAAAAALVGWLNSVWALYAGFLTLGLTGGLYVPSGIALITVMVRRQDWGKAMGIHELAPNLALILAPFLATLSVAAGSWRFGYFSLAAGLALLGLVYARLGVDAPQRPSPPDLQLIREIVTNPSFWCLGFLLSLAVGVETGVYSMVPLFLVNERSFDLADANRLLGLSRMPGLIMVLLSGWITDRLSPSRTVIMALGLTGAGGGLDGDRTQVSADYGYFRSGRYDGLPVSSHFIDGLSDLPNRKPGPHAIAQPGRGSCGRRRVAAGRHRPGRRFWILQYRIGGGRHPDQRRYRVGISDERPDSLNLPA